MNYEGYLYLSVRYIKKIYSIYAIAIENGVYFNYWFIYVNTYLFIYLKKNDGFQNILLFPSKTEINFALSYDTE